MSLTKDEKWLLEEKYDGMEGEAFHADCVRLKDGEPLGYVIGYVPFLDCIIRLDSKPLIPRPETEFWAEQAIKIIQKHSRSNLEELQGSTLKSVQVLDMCAGSGCIGVAVAKAIPVSRVDFAEVEPVHLPIITKNLTENLPIDWKVFRRFRVVQSNLFSGLPTDSTYNFILTNPPYIDPEIDRAEPSVKLHEPHKALYGGKNGMELIERIIAESPQHLTPMGQLWIEHEPEQSDVITHYAKENGFSCTTHKDQYGVERYSVLVIQ